MGYFQQIKLLLWKNCLVKRRLPHILFLETFIPFVLFVILGLIRQHELPLPTQTGYIPAKALPSSGIVSVMQTFCYGSSSFHVDGNGLPKLPENSTLHEWLQKVNNVVKGHYVLFANYTVEIFDQIPSHYEEDVDHYDNVYREIDKLTNITARDSAYPGYISPNDSFLHQRQQLIPSPTIPLSNFSKVEAIVSRINHKNMSFNDAITILSLMKQSNFSSSEPFSRRHLVDIFMPVVLPHASKVLFANGNATNALNFPNNAYNQNVVVLRNISGQSNLPSSELDQIPVSSNDVIYDMIDYNQLADVLNITNATGDSLRSALLELAEDLDEFTKFHSTLDELADIVAYLPLDVCVNPNSTLNGNSSSASDSPKATNFGGLIKIYNSLQPIFCPNDESERRSSPSPTTTEKARAHGEDEGSVNSTSTPLHGESQLSSAVTDHLQILSNILSSNPKILYTPGNTSASVVMKQANKTFEFVDHLTTYARHWMFNISSDLRSYISRPDMDKKLESLRRTQRDLTAFRSVALAHGRNNFSSYYEALSPFLGLHIKNSSQLLAQIDLIDRAACSWVKLMSGVNLSVFLPFDKEYEAVDYALYKAYRTNVTVMAIVVFEVNQTNGKLLPHTSYKIRMNSTFLPSVRKIRPLYWSPQPRNWDYNYYTYGFSWIQDVIDRAIIDVLVGHEVIEPGNFALNFPYPCYQYDIFLFTNDMILPLCMTISFVYTAAILVQNIVSEKENRLKEFMKVMGLSNAVHGMAWFLTAFVQMTFSMTVVTLMLKFSKVLLHSNPFIIWLILELYAVATITFCFLVSALFSKAKIASATAGILYFLSYVPAMYIGIREDIAGGQMPASVKRIASFLSTSAFGLSCKYISLYESEGVGVHWDNISLSPIEHDTFSLTYAIFFMAFDAFVYAISAWYIEHVHPGSFGIPKPWYFPLTKHYWLGNPADDEYEKPPFIAIISDWIKKLCRCNRADLSITEDDQLAAMTSDANATHFESDPTNLPLGVDIDNLTKVYRKTGKLAVNKLSLRLYESQITGLLGHNGAGKTSTMSVLTGILPPSSGTARIYGLDIRTNLDTIRSSVGYCPQYNVLFEQLTGEEHLLFYSGLKRATDAMSRLDVQQMLDDVGLTVKRSTPVNHLSGGMKRKLSVALAFIAQSRLVILDEPTAGVDPYSRRAIWDLIVKYKKGRTILLSTHHMDEADVLSDRIAIISNGRLKCCGSSMFLRNTFCDGYHLICVKDQRNFNWIETMSFVKKSIPSSFLHMESKQELHFILPYSEERAGKFVNFFTQLNKSLSSLGLSSYGVHDSTLEESFLRITQTAQCEEGQTFIRPAASMRHQRRGSAGSFTSATSYSKLQQPSQQPTERDRDVPLLNCASNSNNSATGRGHSRQSSDLSNPGVLHNNGAASTGGPPNSAVTRRQGGGHSRQSSADSVLCHGGVDKTPMPDKQPDATSLLSAADVFALLGSGPSGASCSSLGGGPSYTALCNSPPRFIHLLHFQALMIKRFLYVKRNWKVLFSQVFLPAIFVSIAMSMALSAPNLGDPPPLVLSPAQYYNYTHPRGNFVPLSNYAMRPGKRPTYITGSDGWVDADAMELASTVHLPSGLSATCVLRSPDLFMDTSLFNFSKRDFQQVERFFNPECSNVFASGLPLVNFLPPPPTSMAPRSSTVTTRPKFGPTTTPTTTPSSAGHNSSTKKPPGPPLFYPVCQCAADTSGFFCPSDYEQPPQYQLITGDYIVDIGSQNMTEYSLYTSDEYRLHRYGALTFGNELNHIPSNFGNGLPSEFRRLAVRRVGVFYFNHRGYHSMPSFLNALNNAILRANLQKKPHLGNPAAYGITVYNHPINGTDKVEFQDMATQGTDTMIAVFIIIAMSFVPASFVVFLVYERSLLAKHTQLMAGLHPVTYWLTNYIWDLLNYLIPSTCCIIILAIFNIPAYVAGMNLPAIILLFMLYGWSITPMMYPASFYLSDPSTAYIILVVINLFVGTTCVITSFLLDLFHNSEMLAAVHDFLKIAFLISPSYCLGRGLMDVAINQYRNEFYIMAGQVDKIASPFAWETTMRNCVVMFCEGFIFFGLTLVLEYFNGVIWSGSAKSDTAAKKRRTWTPPSVRDSLNDDPDVIAERHRVLSGAAADDVLLIDGLTKEYSSRAGRLLAVDRLSLGLSSGECFGLLGLNGAGKSTTFSMLTGVLGATAGEARIVGELLCGGRPSAQVMRSVGYCPQTDPLLEELTAREHLQLYARIRAIPVSVQPQIVSWLLERMGLELYADKPSRTFSGGTKRKLSAALALLGNPSTVLLDEPTTGMDPGSRRFLWNLILELRHENRLVVLTSHSMEECEVLCSRLGVMVAGKLRCLGSTQQLKDKFGQGYSVTLRLPSTWHPPSAAASPYGYHGTAASSNNSKPMSPIEMLNEAFTNAGFSSTSWRVVATRHQIVELAVLDPRPDLSLLFKTLQELRQARHILDFSISQNTLDSVFLQLARENEHLQAAAHKNGANSRRDTSSVGVGAGATSSSNVTISDPSTVMWADDEPIEEQDEELLLEPSNGRMRLEIVA